MVEDYHLSAYAQQGRAEAWSSGYDTELHQFYNEVEPRLTFKSWLVGMRRR